MEPHPTGYRAACGGPLICNDCSLALALHVEQHDEMPEHMRLDRPGRAPVTGYPRPDNPGVLAL